MITDKPREEVKKLVMQGELNIKALSHFDICKAKQAGMHTGDIAIEFRITERQVFNIIKSKCPCE